MDGRSDRLDQRTTVAVAAWACQQVPDAADIQGGKGEIVSTALEACPADRRPGPPVIRDGHDHGARPSGRVRARPAQTIRPGNHRRSPRAARRPGDDERDRGRWGRGEGRGRGHRDHGRLEQRSSPAPEHAERHEERSGQHERHQGAATANVASNLPAAIESVDGEVQGQRAKMLPQDPAQTEFERGVVVLTHVAPPRGPSVRRQVPRAGAREPTSTAS